MTCGCEYLIIYYRKEFSDNFTFETILKNLRSLETSFDEKTFDRIAR